jgi:hypothetical protein
MNNIKNILLNKKNINKILKSVIILNDNSTKYIFSNNIYESHTSWIGTNVCGESCFVTKYLLEKYNYKVQVYRNKDYITKLSNDHCFLIVNENIIIDPTYKQFLFNKNKIYNKDTFLINYFDNIDKIVLQLNISNKYWKKEQNITNKFDFNETLLKSNINFKNKYLKIKEIIND